MGETFSLLEKAAALRGDARVVNHSSLARKQVSKLEAKYLGKNGGSLGGDGSSMYVHYGMLHFRGILCFISYFSLAGISHAYIFTLIHTCIILTLYFFLYKLFLSSCRLCGGARWVRYGQSKLANAVFTAELQVREYTICDIEHAGYFSS